MSLAVWGDAALPEAKQGSRPKRYGRFLLIDRLGRGGMAEVFRAVVVGPEQFQRVVVVKRILPHHSANAAFIKMFIDEATLCGRLSHPNIIQVHEFGVQQDQYFIAMEYLKGQNLNAIVSRLIEWGQRMPVSVAAEIIHQACRGLAYAHTVTASDGKPLGIIHRDVSPGNILVAYSGAVKVLDFGVARVADRFRVGTTDPGYLKGKSAYLAPEQLSPVPFDHRVDIFACGILLHEMLTGRRLFRGKTPHESMSLVRSMPIPPPSAIDSRVPIGLDAIVLRALARDPGERYQTAAEMADALEGFLIEQRFTSQELPQFMRSLFSEEERSQDLHLSAAELEALATEGASESPAGAGARSSAPTSPQDNASSHATPPPVMADVMEVSLSAVEEPRPRWRKRVIVGAVGTAAVAVLIVSFARSPAPPPSASVTSPSPSSPSPAPSPTPASAVATAAAAIPAPTAPAKIRLTISSEPSGALTFRNGDRAPVGITPVSVTLARDEAPIVFRISKTGFVPGVLRVVPDADKPVHITLAKSASASPRPREVRKVRDAVPIDPFK